MISNFLCTTHLHIFWSVVSLLQDVDYQLLQFGVVSPFIDESFQMTGIVMSRNIFTGICASYLLAIIMYTRYWHRLSDPKFHIQKRKYHNQTHQDITQQFCNWDEFSFLCFTLQIFITSCMLHRQYLVVSLAVYRLIKRFIRASYVISPRTVSAVISLLQHKKHLNFTWPSMVMDLWQPIK